MLNFKHWEKAVETRDKILSEETNPDNVEQIINSALDSLADEQSSTKEEKLEFINHLNSLFLTILITEGQDHSKSLENVRKAREILKSLKSKFK